VQIEKPGNAGSHAQHHVCCCQMESTATPLDTDNFTFALRLQHDDHQSHSSEFIAPHSELAVYFCISAVEIEAIKLCSELTLHAVRD